MVVFCLYLLKVSACLALFYGLYIILFKHITFFTINRLYLISGLFLSFLIPVVQFSMDASPAASFTKVVRTPFFEPESFVKPQHFNNSGSFDFSIYLIIIYLAGVAILLIRQLSSIVVLKRMQKDAESFYWGKIKVIKTDQQEPFSFLNKMYLPKDEVNPLIMEHEKVHIQQLHWIDLIIAEIATIILWFNPLIFLYKNAIKIQHEYEADSIVSENNIESYLNCLVEHIQVVNSLSLISKFYCKTIKKRIIMVTKNKTSRFFKAVYLFLIPFSYIMVVGFSKKPTELMSIANLISNYPANNRNCIRWQLRKLLVL